MEQSAMTANRKISQSYLELIMRFPLVHIDTETQNNQALELLDELSARDKLDPGERAYYLALGDLVDVYENKVYPIQDATPLELIKHLMEANQLKQTDLIAEFGSKSLVSDFLSGKRELSKTQIEKLSKRFSVSPAALLAQG
jgi:HTH-type transcriptional regulator/antitoxin HigA